jgi:hypothetical protein
MCDDLKNEMAALHAKGVECAEAVETRWGSITKIRLRGGGEIGLYKPKHPDRRAERVGAGRSWPQRSPQPDFEKGPLCNDSKTFADGFQLGLLPACRQTAPYA